MSTRFWLFAGAVAVVAVGGYGGFRVLSAPTNGHALAYADHMRVRGGYVRIDDYNGGDGSCGCDLDRWWIGPVTPNPILLVSGPGLEIAPDAPAANDPDWQLLGGGPGYAPSTGRCVVAISRLKHTSSLYDYPSIWHLSSRQIVGWKAGSLDILEVDLLCDRDQGD